MPKGEIDRMYKTTGMSQVLIKVLGLALEKKCQTNPSKFFRLQIFLLMGNFQIYHKWITKISFLTMLMAKNWILQLTDCF